MFSFRLEIFLGHQVMVDKLDMLTQTISWDTGSSVVTTLRWDFSCRIRDLNDSKKVFSKQLRGRRKVNKIKESKANRLQKYVPLVLISNHKVYFQSDLIWVILISGLSTKKCPAIHVSKDEGREWFKNTCIHNCVLVCKKNWKKDTFFLNCHYGSSWWHIYCSGVTGCTSRPYNLCNLAIFAIFGSFFKLKTFSLLVNTCNFENWTKVWKCD